MEEIAKIAARVASKFPPGEELRAEASQLVWEFFLEYPAETRSSTNPRLLKKLRKDLGYMARFTEISLVVEDKDGNTSNPIETLAQNDTTAETILLQNEEPLEVEPPTQEIDQEALREARANFTWEEQLIHSLRENYGYNNAEVGQFFGTKEQAIKHVRWRHKKTLNKENSNMKNTRMFVSWLKIKLK